MSVAANSSQASTSVSFQAVGVRSIELRALIAALVATFALDNVLLLAFLGQPPVLVALAALAFPLLTAAAAYRSIPARVDVDATTVLACLAVAVVLLLLGGEGRLFFATEDWQVRDALLADLGSHRWPFDYWLEGRSQVMRAPIGMYLVPAMLGGASQAGRDWALLAHNAFVLTLIFSIGAPLFATPRARILALVTFVFFSGFDVVGAALVELLGVSVNWDHLENWSRVSQYSSHITQLFWVPHHAFAGWTCAVLYLLWRRGMAPVGVFGASIPLVAIWSPLAILGAIPFAIFAGARALLKRAWRANDVAICLFATLASLPSLIYLQVYASAIGGGPTPIPFVIYVFVIVLEALPFLWPTLRDKSSLADRPTLAIVAVCLLLMPLWRVGASADFQMRASIMPLAILAVAFAGWALHANRGAPKIYFVVALVLGSATGLTEMLRIRLAPSPAPLCSLQGVWNKQSLYVAAYATYFAPTDKFPTHLLPKPPVARAGVDDPSKCWAHPWRVPRGAH